MLSSLLRKSNCVGEHNAFMMKQSLCSASLKNKMILTGVHFVFQGTSVC